MSGFPIPYSRGTHHLSVDIGYSITYYSRAPMPVTTSQQLANYFRDFAKTEVTFSKEVIRATRLNPSGVHLKCLGDQWPCVIVASSMMSARIITNLQSSLNDTLRKANNVVSLRFSFRETDKTRPIAFFVKAKTTGFTPYGNDQPNLYYANLNFSQHPPDDLILVVGKLLEANHNAKRRAEWRVQMSAPMVKTLGIVPDQTTVTTNGGPKRAILRDVSFSGCKAIVAVPSNEIEDTSVRVSLTFQDPDETFQFSAQIRSSDPIEGHAGICITGFKFTDEQVPIAYKLRLNNAIRAQRGETSE